MKKEIIQMQKLFEATEMTSPLNEHAQAHSLKMKRKNLVSLMRKSGIYSSLYGIILSFFFLLKKIGLGLSVIQSAYLLLSITIAAATSISAGGVFAAKNYLLDTNRSEVEELSMGALSKVRGTAEKSSRIESGEAKTKHQEKYIYFQGFVSNNTDTALIRRATQALTGAFRRTTAGTAITIGNDPCARYRLSGSIEIIDGRYQISARLIDAETRRIIFASSEESDTADGILDYAKKIGAELSGENLF